MPVSSLFVQLKPLLIAVVGPTAVGKTAIAQMLTEQYHGEIITADSRTIYRGLDIGTAKPDFVVGNSASCGCSHFFGSVRHHLIDIIDPIERFSVAEFQLRAKRCVAAVLAQRNVPIVCGGTGLYVSSIIDPGEFSHLETAPQVRAKLEQKPLPELVTLLREQDTLTAQKIDLKNPRRVIRALEIVLGTEKPRQPLPERELAYTPRVIGLTLPLPQLYERIEKRIKTQLAQGLEKEAFSLAQCFGWEVPAFSAIGYREWQAYARGETTRSETITRLHLDSRRYAKRQLTWFKRDRRIEWFSPDEEISIRTTVASYFQNQEN